MKHIPNPTGRQGKPIILPPTTFEDAVKKALSMPVPSKRKKNRNEEKVMALPPFYPQSNGSPLCRVLSCAAHSVISNPFSFQPDCLDEVRWQKPLPLGHVLREDGLRVVLGKHQLLIVLEQDFKRIEASPETGRIARTLSVAPKLLPTFVDS